MAGITLLLLAVSMVLSIVFSGSSDADPFNRQEVDDLMRDINKDEGIYIIGSIFNVIFTSVGLVAAPLLYLMFRGRDRVLALMAFALFLAGFVAVMGSTAGYIVQILIASDFVDGGPGNLAAGDPAILEVGRAVATWTTLFDQMGITAIGLSLIAFGTIITSTPLGAGANPPRWLGWVACLSGLAFVISWLIALVDGAFVLFIVGGLAMLIFLVVLGIWLLRSPNAAVQAA